MIYCNTTHYLGGAAARAREGARYEHWPGSGPATRAASRAGGPAPWLGMRSTRGTRGMRWLDQVHADPKPSVRRFDSK